MVGTGIGAIAVLGLTAGTCVVVHTVCRARISRCCARHVQATRYTARVVMTNLAALRNLCPPPCRPPVCCPRLRLGCSTSCVFERCNVRAGSASSGKTPVGKPGAGDAHPLLPFGVGNSVWAHITFGCVAAAHLRFFLPCLVMEMVCIAFEIVISIIAPGCVQRCFVCVSAFIW